MATGNWSNDFQAAATALSTTANRTPAEHLFHEALQDARVEASSKNDRKLLDFLPAIQDESTLRKAIETVIDPKAAGRTSRKIARMFEHLERPFEIARRVSETSRSNLLVHFGVVPLS